MTAIKQMTLQEYLNQSDPQRMPKVELGKEEYKVLATSKSGGNTTKLIYIDAIAQRFDGCNGVYYQINDEMRLVTENRKLTCFYLK